MMTFVMVHGSWHRGRAWRYVAQQLERHGHRVHTPDGPRHRGGAAGGMTFGDYTDTIAHYIEQCKLTNFVLVGHSFGGAVVAKLAERLSTDISRLVFVSAIVPRHGCAVLDEMPPDYAAGFKALADASANNTVLPSWPMWRDIFIGDADGETAKAAFDELVPEPFGPVTEKLDLSRFYALEIPKSYIHCTEDAVFPPGEWGWFPRMYTRLGLCRLVLAAGSHEMMYSNPQRLAEALIKAARD